MAWARKGDKVLLIREDGEVIKEFDDIMDVGHFVDGSAVVQKRKIVEAGKLYWYQ